MRESKELSVDIKDVISSLQYSGIYQTEISKRLSIPRTTITGVIITHLEMYTSICWYLSVLPVLHRPDVVDIGVNTI